MDSSTPGFPVSLSPWIYWNSCPLSRWCLGEKRILCHSDSGSMFEGYMHTHMWKHSTCIHVTRAHTVSDSLGFSRWESIIVNLEEHPLLEDKVLHELGPTFYVSHNFKWGIFVFIVLSWKEGQNVGWAPLSRKCCIVLSLHWFIIHWYCLINAFLTKLQRTVSGTNDITLKTKVARRKTDVNCFSALETWVVGFPPNLMVLVEVRWWVYTGWTFPQCFNVRLKGKCYSHFSL